MKKSYLAIAVMALVLGVTACSSQTEETTAQSEETTQGTSEETEAEDVEVDYFDGSVNVVEEFVVTVADAEGTERKFDISDAEVTGAEAVGVGDEVEVTYDVAALSDDTTPALEIEVLVSAAEETEEGLVDEVINGTISEVGDGTLTLETEDGTYTFNTLIGQQVTEGGLNAGAEAEVTYYGDLEDTEDLPVITRIVTADAMGTEDASIYTLTGEVAEVDANHVVLDTADPANTFFAFEGEGVFADVQVGDTITVIYEGSLTGRTITAVGVR